ncbi:MAG: universal stress protein [Ferrimicrobium sp.]
MSVENNTASPDDRIPSQPLSSREPNHGHAEELVAPAGQFRLYLGAASGVGKTVAMLDEGHRRFQRGTDVVVGFVETHDRPFTRDRTVGLEVIPRKSVNYRGAQFEEMDLQAILDRRPEVTLVDELAHTNVPTSGCHDKRWEDVVTLLDAGISVISTVNIQHIESLADAIELMTGTTVRERVPDAVVRRADQVELVDSSPEQLRRRLLHGNIYAPDKISDALTNFFRIENLNALRELSLRFVADDAEGDLIKQLERLGRDGVWETKERVMVAITGAAGSDQILHRAARIATRSKGELHAVHVLSDEAAIPTASSDLMRLAETARELGGTWEVLSNHDIPTALVAYATAHKVTQIVVGATAHSRWRSAFRSSVLNNLIRSAGAEGIDVHVIARRSRSDAKQDARSTT